jgi:quinol monooxygenase YgiN
MVIEYVRYRLKNATAETFVAAYRAAAESLAQSPHCLRYELARCTEEPDRFVLRIEWTSIAGHLEGFRKSELFRSFLAAIRPYVSDIEEMQHYELTEVASLEAAD